MARIKTFPNGLRLVLESRRSRHTTIVVGIGCGSSDEQPRHVGRIHFIEHLITSRWPGREDVAFQADWDDIEMEAQTSQDAVLFSCSSPHRAVRWALSHLMDLILVPEFTDADLALERSVIVEEWSEDRDLLDPWMDRLRDRILFNGYGYQLPVLGRPSTLSRFSQRSLMAYWSRLLDPANMIVAVVGRFDPRMVIGEVGERLGTLPRPSDPIPRRRRQTPTDRTERVLLQFLDFKQINGILSIILPGIRTKYRYAFMVLEDILGRRISSPLFMNLRRDGRVYDITTSVWHYPEVGHLDIYFGATPLNFLPALETILGTLQQYRRDGVPPEQIALSKRTIQRRLRENHRSPYHTARSHCGHLLSCGRLIDSDAYCRAIRALTVHDINRAAKQFLVPRRTYMTAVGPLTRAYRRNIRSHFQ